MPGKMQRGQSLEQSVNSVPTTPRTPGDGQLREDSFVETPKSPKSPKKLDSPKKSPKAQRANEAPKSPKIERTQCAIKNVSR